MRKHNFSEGNVTVEMLEELVDLKSMSGMAKCTGSVNGLS